MLTRTSGLRRPSLAAVKDDWPPTRDDGYRRDASRSAHRDPGFCALAQRAWSLPHNFSFYDALHVAAGSHVDILRLTAGKQLSRAPRRPARRNSCSLSRTRQHATLNQKRQKTRAHVALPQS
jgi:hypothetical protein